MAAQERMCRRLQGGLDVVPDQPEKLRLELVERDPTQARTVDEARTLVERYEQPAWGYGRLALTA
jgi:hypothetical protein